MEDRNPWVEFQTTDRRPWVDRLGNRHSWRTKRFTTPQKYLDAGCRWDPQDAGEDHAPCGSCGLVHPQGFCDRI